jgi:hypothetical protein
MGEVMVERYASPRRGDALVGEPIPELRHRGCWGETRRPRRAKLEEETKEQQERQREQDAISK